MKIKNQMVRVMIIRKGNTAYVSQVVQNENHEWALVPDSEFEIDIEDSCEAEK